LRFVHRSLTAELVEGFNEASPCGLLVCETPGMLEQLGQIRAPEKRHAEQPQTRCWIIVHGMNGDDMSVLKAGQYSRLVSLRAGHLEGDKPVPETGLLRQINSGKCTSTEF
jgi:hypothetical protein